MEKFEARYYQVFIKIIDPQQRLATDLTGRLPVISKQEHKYLFIIYEYDSKSILIHPMKARTDTKFIHILQDLHEHLITRGLNPNYMGLENEASLELQDLLKEKEIDYQLAPPGINQHNTEYGSIIKFRDHFISGLFLTYPYFPMQNWDLLLKNVEITLNLLLPSRLNPRLSKYSQMNGKFYFNQTPMASTYTENPVHNNPHNRGIWAPPIQKVCYVRPAMLHQRCLT